MKEGEVKEGEVKVDGVTYGVVIDAYEGNSFVMCHSENGASFNAVSGNMEKICGVKHKSVPREEIVIGSTACPKARDGACTTLRVIWEDTRLSEAWRVFPGDLTGKRLARVSSTIPDDLIASGAYCVKDLSVAK